MAEFTNLSSIKVAGKVESSYQGRLIGAVDSVGVDALPATPDMEGLIVFLTTDKTFRRCNGSNWDTIIGDMVLEDNISKMVEDGVKDVSDALTTAQSALQKNIDDLSARHDTEMDAAEGRIGALETGISGLDTRMGSVEGTVTTLGTGKADKTELAGYVPTSRKVNNKALSADIELSASDVGALPSGGNAVSATKATQDGLGQDIVATYATKTELNDAVLGAAGSVYRPKGSKNYYTELPTENNAIGDVWNVVNPYGNTPAGTNYVWNGTEWDALGGTIDLSIYAKANDLNTHVADTTKHITAAERTAWNAKADQSVVNSLSGNLTALQEKVDGLDIPDGVLVDDELNLTSVNPVQNKIITARINSVESAANAKENPLTFDAPLHRTGNTVTHNDSTVTAGDYGSGTEVPKISVDAKGHVTAITTEEVPIPTKISDLTNDSSFVTTDNLNSILAGYQAKGDYVVTSDLNNRLESKQDKLTFDSAPVESSNNPVTSGGVFSAINTLQTAVDGKQKTITVSSDEPTASDGADGDIWAVLE